MNPGLRIVAIDRATARLIYALPRTYPILLETTEI